MCNHKRERKGLLYEQFAGRQKPNQIEIRFTLPPPGMSAAVVEDFDEVDLSEE